MAIFENSISGESIWVFFIIIIIFSYCIQANSLNAAIIYTIIMSEMSVWGWGRLSITFSSVNPIEINIPGQSIGMFIGRKESLI